MNTVRIIGTGLLGTSLGLALTRLGVDIQLVDSSPVTAGLAQDLGAGHVARADDPEPDLVIVAAPPDVVADLVRQALTDFPHALVSDVASVKDIIAQEVISHPGASRYAGCHPMAGRERSGAVAADADLFTGRAWVIVPHESTDDRVLTALNELAIQVGALPLTMSASEHDHAVARISHLPQVMSSLVAARLADAPAASLELAGQGIRDVTRIASSDPGLWSAIIEGNAGPVAALLHDVYRDLGELINALEHLDPRTQTYTGMSQVASVISAGNVGVARIPGKHGGAPVRYAQVTVLVPDEPGELGRLFTETGDIGVNIEDLSLEHSAGQPVGRAHIMVAPAMARPLAEGLAQRGWVIAGGVEEN